MVDIVVRYLINAGINKYLAYAIAYLGVTAVTSWAMRALSPKQDFDTNTGLLANTRQATAPQEIVYGEIRKGGVVTFIESTGDTNQYLHQIICLAGHEVNAIGDIYINDEVVTWDSSTGLVTTSKWQDADGNSKIRIRKHLGADNQTADSDLVSETSVTSDFKGEGIAYLYVRMEYDQSVFAEGIPLFTAKVQGKKVYDPRTSSSGYSANAALCIRDYLVSAYGLDNTGVTNDTVFQAAANTCDEDVTLSGGGTEDRYAINGVVRLDRTPSDILGDMMTACAGTLFWGQGNWQLKVGEYTSPVKTLTLDDFRSGISLETKHSRRDNFNIVRGTFIDASTDFIQTDYPEIRSSTFIANDNSIESALDLSLPFTTSSAMAQRLAKMTLFRAREEMTLTADFGLNAFNVQVGDIIGITNSRYGFSAKDFEVVGWKFKNDSDGGELAVSLTLRETSSSAFSWSAEESAITSNDSTLTSALGSITPSNIAVADFGDIQTDGSFITQVKVSWTAAANKFISHYEVRYKVTSKSDYLHSQTDADETSLVISGLQSGTQYNVEVRGVTASGRYSAWVAASAHTVGGDTTAPSPVTSLSATGGIQSVTLDWTAPTTEVGGNTLYDLKGYNIYRSTSNSQPANAIAFVNADKYVDGGLSASTTYYYWVVAIDHTNNSSTVVASGAVTTQATPTDGADGADGADGVNGTNGTNGADGADGATGDTVISGKVFYTVLQSSAPNTPTASSYNVSTASFSGLSSDWSLTQPSVDITDTSVREWSSNFTVTIDGSTNAQTLVFTSPSGAIQVTTDLESDNYVAGSSGWHIERDTGNAEFQNATIRGTLNATDITAGTLNIARFPELGQAESTVFNTGSISRNGTPATVSVSFNGVKTGANVIVIASVGGNASNVASPFLRVTPTSTNVTLDSTSYLDIAALEGSSTTKEYYAVMMTGSTSSTSGSIGFSIQLRGNDAGTGSAYGVLSALILSG